MDADIGWRLSNSYSQLPSHFFEPVAPSPVQQPSLVVVNVAVADLLGLSAKSLTHQEQIEILAGNRLPPNAFPIAQAYAGHQYGGFTMLGDGRAILLGEQRTPGGQLFDIQLKGSGPTRYSRRGDGRASLGPMLREYVISHAMQALGIPTTLSLAVVRTGQTVFRFGPEPGAILTRVASSHLRVGTFQYAAAHRNSEAQLGKNTTNQPIDSALSAATEGVDILQVLANYAIHRHYPELKALPDVYLQFLRSVIRRQADLVSRWMCVGFVHGVMNTDNVSIAGETIDYGPCAFMNTYSPSTVFSSIDEQGRYAFGNQPGICQWNLARFAESLLPLLSQSPEEAIQIATAAIREFPEVFLEFWLSGMRRKIGLVDSQAEDRELVESLLGWMEAAHMDFTNTMRDLAMGKFERQEYQSEQFQHWNARWSIRRQATGISQEESQEQMRNSNPAIIPRNHRVEEALRSAVDNDDLGSMLGLIQALTRPYEETPENEQYRDPPPGGEQGYCTYCGT